MSALGVEQLDKDTVLVDVMDWNGVWCKVPLPQVDRQYIPEQFSCLGWYIVCTITKPMPPSAPRLDQLVCAELMALGLPVIMPVDAIQCRVRDPQTGRTSRKLGCEKRLLFPGYVMVGFAGNDERSMDQILSKVNACRHVRGVISYQNKPIRIDHAGIERLIKGLNEGAYDESRNTVDALSSLKVMDLVEIMDGPFEFRTGKIEKLRTGADGDNRLITNAFVRLELFGQETRAEIPIDSLKLKQ